MSDIDIRFGNFIKERRKSLKMTQQEAADALGMPRTTYQHYEKGETQATMDVLLAMEKVFGFLVDDFVALERKR